jgi:hypothetical protein
VRWPITSRALGFLFVMMVVPRAKRGLVLLLLTPNLELFYLGNMSNAESDRKPDGSAEDDDEPDEWCVCGGDGVG